ncbi:MAG: hypothetical protein ACK4OM_05045 [Alphaproteobacteria bacterium]
MPGSNNNLEKKLKIQQEREATDKIFQTKLTDEEILRAYNYFLMNDEGRSFETLGVETEEQLISKYTETYNEYKNTNNIDTLYGSMLVTTLMSYKGVNTAAGKALSKKDYEAFSQNLQYCDQNDIKSGIDLIIAKNDDVKAIEIISSFDKNLATISQTYIVHGATKVLSYIAEHNRDNYEENKNFIEQIVKDIKRTKNTIPVETIKEIVDITLGCCKSDLKKDEFLKKSSLALLNDPKLDINMSSLSIIEKLETLKQSTEDNRFKTLANIYIDGFKKLDFILSPEQYEEAARYKIFCEKVSKESFNDLDFKYKNEITISISDILIENQELYKSFKEKREFFNEGLLIAEIKTAFKPQQELLNKKESLKDQVNQFSNLSFKSILELGLLKTLFLAIDKFLKKDQKLHKELKEVKDTIQQFKKEFPNTVTQSISKAGKSGPMI